VSIEADCRTRLGEQCFNYETCWVENRCAFNEAGAYIPLAIPIPLWQEVTYPMKTEFRPCPRKCEGQDKACPTCLGEGQVLKVDAEHEFPGTWPVFVFGSNLQGAHGAGAAEFALNFRGAVIGQGEGQYGHSYALPTRSYDARDGFVTLSLEEIRSHVEKFLAHARRRTKERFFVTALGTGYAGLKHEDIAPMFVEVPPNVILPEEWEALNVRP